jgi:hypothetical protein
MRITFHTFQMGDVDDVDIYVAAPIYDWQQTEHGQWVMKHARELRYYTRPDIAFWGTEIAISGDLEDGPLVTEYFLKWPNKES